MPLSLDFPLKIYLIWHNILMLKVRKPIFFFFWILPFFASFSYTTLKPININMTNWGWFLIYNISAQIQLCSWRVLYIYFLKTMYFKTFFYGIEFYELWIGTAHWINIIEETLHGNFQKYLWIRNVHQINTILQEIQAYYIYYFPFYQLKITCVYKFEYMHLYLKS